MEEQVEMEAASAAFTFIQELAGELNRDSLELPSFPEAVIRIRSALEDADCSVEKLTRIAGSEPALAGRLLKMSNSALLQRGSKQVTELRTAIGRLGFTMVRNAAISVAMEQMFNAKKLGNMANEIKSLWQVSTKVSALSYVIARGYTKLNSDEAFLAGLMHNVGKLYIFTRVDAHPEFLEDKATMAHVLEEWHGPIGRSIIESWGFSEAQAAAAEHYQDMDRKPDRGGPDLTDIVQVATILAGYSSTAEENINLELIPGCVRIGLCGDAAARIIEESNEEIRALADALKG